MPNTHPLSTLTALLHTNGWVVQLAAAPAPAPRSPRGVAYVVPAAPLPTPGDLR